MKSKVNRVNSRRKGAVGERQVRDLLRKFGFCAARGQQFSGGSDSPDVVHNIPNCHIEVKFVVKLDFTKAFEQAKRDAGCKVPLVIFRKNGEKWRVYSNRDSILGLFQMSEIGHLLTQLSLVSGKDIHLVDRDKIILDAEDFLFLCSNFFDL